MKKETTAQLLLEELESSKTQEAKQMILQKYGAIEPKLTQEEKWEIMDEENDRNWGL